MGKSVKKTVKDGVDTAVVKVVKKGVKDDLLAYLGSPKFMENLLADNPQRDLNWAASSRDAGAMAKILDSHPKLDVADAARSMADSVDVKCLRVLAPRMDRAAAAKALCRVLQAKDDGRFGRTAKELADCERAAGLLIPLADLDSPSSMGMTSLMWAIRADLPKVVEKIAGRCDVEAKSDDSPSHSLFPGATALLVASARGRDACLSALIPLCDHAARDVWGRTALMLYSGDSMEILEKLIMAGDVLAQDKEGFSAMECFVDRGAYAMATKLFEAAPDRGRTAFLRRLDKVARNKGRRYDPEQLEEIKELRAALFTRMEAAAIAEASPSAKKASKARLRV